MLFHALLLCQGEMQYLDGGREGGREGREREREREGGEGGSGQGGRQWEGKEKTRELPIRPGRKIIRSSSEHLLL